MGRRPAAPLLYGRKLRGQAGLAALSAEAACGATNGRVGFARSAHFVGARPGYVFTTREQGTGYYLDVCPRVRGGVHAVSALPRLRAVASEARAALDWGSVSDRSPTQAASQGEEQRTRLPPLFEVAAQPKGLRRARSSTSSQQSLPALPGVGTSEGSSSRQRLAAPVELSQLPLIEALRQLLIEKAGSLRKAYSAMDVSQHGEVDVTDFECGLRTLRIFGSPLAEFPTLQSLFERLDEGGTGVISLQEVLGYIPLRKPIDKAKDTCFLWADYHNKASAQRSELARPPCWRVAELSPDSVAQEQVGREAAAAPAGSPESKSIQANRRRELRRQLHDAQNAKSAQKKAAPRLSVSSEAEEEINPVEQWAAVEHRKILGQRGRIEDAIRGCSRARHALVDMQRMMVGLSSERVSKELRDALGFAGKFQKKDGEAAREGVSP